MKKSIGNRIRSAFTVVNGLMMVVALNGAIALAFVYHSANKAMQEGARLNAIGLEIQENHLLARRFEKDFLLNIKTLGVEKAKQQYASKVPLAAARIDELAAEGNRIAAKPADRERLEAIPALVRTYASGFADVVAAREKRGHVDTGAEGEFREAVHRIEAQVKNVDKLEIAMLTLRRSEKDYLLRGDEQYITATVENVKKFKAALDESPLPPEEKASERKLADAYESSFRALVDADREVAAKTAIYEEATRRLEAAADLVARAGWESSQDSLSSASTTAWIAIIFGGVVSLGAIGAGVTYGRRISDHITRPVKHLTGVAERVSLGDLSLKVEHTCDDEIGDLEDSLSRLVTAVKFFQAESEDAMATAGVKEGTK